MKILNLEQIETLGITVDKRWATVQDDNGEVFRALFKPDKDENDTNGKNEIRAMKIAKLLQIPTAEIFSAKIRGKNGILSRDVNTDSAVIPIPACRIFHNGSGFTTRSRAEDGETYENVTISMQIIRDNDKFQPIEKGVVEMAYFDCLISLLDRHGNNWFINQDKNGNFVGIAPLFDNACSFEQPNIEERMIDKAQFVWDLQSSEVFDGDNGDFRMSHFDIFRKLCEHYPEQIEKLLEITKNAAATGKLDSFCLPRLAKMVEIFQL